MGRVNIDTITPQPNLLLGLATYLKLTNILQNPVKNIN